MSACRTGACRNLWLFPITYALHAAEECFCGETFPVWISRLGHVQFTSTDFLWLNSIAMLVMLGAVWIGLRRQAGGWPAATLATVVVINALAHLAGTIATWSYSLGVIAAGVLIGILAHGIVSSCVLLAC